MADENYSGEQESGKKKGPGKLGMVVAGFMVVAIAIGLLQDDEEPSVTEPSSTQGEFDPEQARLEEQQQRAEREEIGQQSGSDSAEDASGLDPYAAMSAMTRRQEMLEQKLDEVTSELQEAQGSAQELSKLEKQYGQLEGQLRDLTEMLKNDAEASRLADRENSADFNQNGDDLTFDLEGAISESELEGTGDSGGSVTTPRQKAKPYSPYGENYIVLNGGTRNPILSGSGSGNSGSAGGSGGSDGGLFGSPDGLEAPNPFSDDGETSSQPATGGSGGYQSGQVTAAGGLTPEYQQDVQAGYARTSSPSQAAGQSAEEEPDTTINVPAFSFVDAETLHGLDCPIGPAMPRGATGGDAGGVTPGGSQPMPVVLPLRGEIRGPNGNVVDLGSAHVQGWCIGRRVDRGESGRAMIKIEAISYWDRNGEPQYLNSISGDVISRTDNHRGIQAPVDEVRRSYMGEQAGAAALAAAATQLNQAQFEETRNPEGGVDRVFNGNQAMAIGSQGGAAAFQTVAELINEEAERAYDAVRVPSGAPVRILFMKPFEVTNTKLEVEDELLDAYDILI